MEPEQIKDLVGKLDSSSYEIRLEVAKRLEEAGGKAVPYLIEGLGSDQWMVRQDCADVLGKIGAPEAQEPLYKLLDDKEPGVRTVARQALDRIIAARLEADEAEDGGQA